MQSVHGWQLISGLAKKTKKILNKLCVLQGNSPKIEKKNQNKKMEESEKNFLKLDVVFDPVTPGKGIFKLIFF